MKFYSLKCSLLGVLVKFYSLKCPLTPLEQEDELDVKYYLEDSYISDLTVVYGKCLEVKAIYRSMRGYKRAPITEADLKSVC